MKKAVSGRQYMINLQKWRSIVSLIACAVTMILSFAGVNASMVRYMKLGLNAADFFKYMTSISNILTGAASSFIIPFAVEGIRKKRFTMPKWLNVFFYAGTICTTVTMLFTLFVILPFNAEFAVAGSNFYFHFICPVTVLVSFLLIESNRRISWRDLATGMIPFLTYSIVYFVMVVIIGEENGGWEDLYLLNTIVPWYVSLPALWAAAFGVSAGIKKASNVISGIREKKTFAKWGADMEPIEVVIEAFGLGRYNGLHGDVSTPSIPYDILDFLADRYSIDPMKLVGAYTKGLIDGIEEKKARDMIKAAENDVNNNGRGTTKKEKTK